jgi:hypothetical protein
MPKASLERMFVKPVSWYAKLEPAVYSINCSSAWDPSVNWGFREGPG